MKIGPQLFRKLERLLDELKEHPYTGTGHPEQLKYLQGVVFAPDAILTIFRYRKAPV